MHPQLKVEPQVLADLCRRHHVLRLSMFGSAVREDFDAERSDVDVMVEFEPARVPSLAGLVALQDELSELFGDRKVDVTTPSVLRNPYRRRSIEADLEVLYAAPGARPRLPVGHAGGGARGYGDARLED